MVLKASVSTVEGRSWIGLLAQSPLRDPEPDPLESRPGLIERFRAGDPAVLELVYCSCRAYVTSLVRAEVHRTDRGSGRMAAAEVPDLVQEVFIRLLGPKARLGYRGDGPIKAYVASIARNVLRDWIRHKHREIPTTPETLDRLRDNPSSTDHADVSEPAAAFALRVLLRELPPQLRAIHEKRYAAGLSERETAAALGVGRQTVRTLDRRLRAELLAAFRSEGHAT
jgi:RNA polymerase sigma factor (sigma-70 family)